MLAAAVVIAVALFAGAALSAPDRRGQAQAEQAARSATEKTRRLEAAEQQLRELTGRLAATTTDAQRWRNRARRAERQLNRNASKGDADERCPLDRTADPRPRAASHSRQGCLPHTARGRRAEDSDTTFVDVTAFGALAGNCGEYLSQGRAVAVSGRLAYREWATDDGARRSKHEVVAGQVDFLPGGRSHEPETVGAATA